MHAEAEYESTIVQAGKAAAHGNFAEAERLALCALELNPKGTGALLIQGISLANTGRLEQSARILEEVLAAEPKQSSALLWLSRVARALGDVDKSLRLAERAAHGNAKDRNMVLNLAESQLAARQFTEAAANLEQLSKTPPVPWQVLHLLGVALIKSGRHAEAVPALREALKLEPSAKNSRIELAELLLTLGESLDEAVEHADAAIKIDPKDFKAHDILAEALVKAGQTARAESAARELVVRFPKDQRAFAMSGMRLIALGKIEEGRANLRRSIEMAPVQGFAYRQLAYSVRAADIGPELVRQMEDLAGSPVLNLEAQRDLYYGLGKAYEGLGRYEEALTQFDEANRIDYELKTEGRRFDAARHSQIPEFMAKTLNRNFFQRFARAGVQDAFPIFIVGMIRSGTTLAEQIISAHPQVVAAGEQTFWQTNLHRVFRGTELDPKEAAKLATEYLKLMRGYGPDALHGIDKMPANYVLAGVLHAIFPNARIIHMQRHPVDTCISIYTTPNVMMGAFTNNRANIVFAYRQYLKIMEHWRTVLPPDRFLEVRYEDLVLSQESETRKILEFCGLDWDEACLQPEANERSVSTPSVWQVRQPMYASSMGRWKNYEPWLGEFAELLAEADRHRQ